jgi:hypothetical protein
VTSPPRSPSPPPLPKDAPPELAAFVACHADRVDLVAGSARWLPSPPGLGRLLAPKVSIARATQPTEADVAIGWALAKLHLRAHVVDGRLRVEHKGQHVPLLRDVYHHIEAWVAGLNEWLAANGRRLGPPEVSSGRLTVVKELADGAAGPGD